MFVTGQFDFYLGVYECVVTNVVIPSSGDQLLFGGKHAEGKCDDDVSCLFFEKGKVLQIPQGVGDTFKNIETLIVIYAKLKSITKHDLKQFHNLKVLNLDYNDLEYLPGDLLEFTTKIETISFNENKIKYIGPALLDSLPHLKTADFSRNIAIDKMYSLNPNHWDFDNISTFVGIREHILTHCKPPGSEIENTEDEIKNLPPKSSQGIRENHKINFLDDMQTFLTHDDFKDFTMKVGDREFKVHKFIFLARSETFAELIKNNPEAEDLVLQDISVEVFECILSYVYSDKPPQTATQNTHEVFAAAGRLKIKGLMSISAQMLINSMENEQNLEILFQIMSLANKFAHNELRLKAFEEIKKHFPGSQLNDELARKPEKLKKIIGAKLVLEQQFKDLKIDDDGEVVTRFLIANPAANLLNKNQF